MARTAKLFRWSAEARIQASQCVDASLVASKNASCICKTWYSKAGNTKVKRFLHRLIDRCSESTLLSETPMRDIRLTSTARHSYRIAATLACVVVLAGAPLMQAMGRGERHESRHLIDNLEERWRQAVLNRNVTTMDLLLAEDYVAITPNGMVQSKDDALNSLRNGQVHFTSLDISDRKVRFYGTTALVTSRVEVNGSGPNGEVSGSYRYTHVYARDAKGVWRIVSFEANKIRTPEEHK